MQEVKKDLEVSVFQVSSNDSFEDNSKKILKLLKVHDLKSVDLCVFPECALYININKKDKSPHISLEDSFFKEVQSLAKKNNVVIHLGSLPIYRGGQLFNTSLVVDEEGLMAEAYDKIHLFAAEIGHLSIDESTSFSSGLKPKVINVKGWVVGLSICFDLRFSDLYSHYAKQGCDLILIPAAFFRLTGAAHWETLNKARAIECQAYVVSPGQVGVHKSVESGAIRKSYGHSLVVHPWGNILADLGGEGEAIETLSLKKEEIEKNRKSILMKRKLLKG